MYVLIYPEGGLGRQQPIKLLASQVLVFQNNGTPIMVAAEYGPAGAQALSKVTDDDFNKTLQDLGIPMTVLHDDIVLPPPPPGAQLLAGPRKGALHHGK